MTAAALPLERAAPAGGADVVAFLRAQEKKDLVRFVAIGSVDDGKSTLIGRLLHDAQGLYQDQLDAVRLASLRGSTRGAGSTAAIDFSLFTDGLMAEREQGITIDVAYRYFATSVRKFIIADTPGHVQYTRNMATGASTADVAVVLVDARLGILPQTRRHARIAALLGIPHVVACVNKMDLVGFDETRFAAIAEELAAIAAQACLAGLFAIPVSALEGDNVVTPSARMPWWTGGTMLGHLETLDVSGGAQAAPLRLPVQLVLRPGLAYRGFAGQIASGTVSVGDEIVVLPSGKRTRVVAVDIAGRDVGSASAPASVALRLADELDVSRGDVIASVGDMPKVASDVEADLVWMSERASDPGKTYLVKHGTRTVRAVLEVQSGTDPATFAPVPSDVLGLNDIGRVRVRCRAPIVFDAYEESRGTGAFIVIDSVTNDTVGAGMIRGVEGAGPARLAGREHTQVSARERRERLGQTGAVVTLSAPTLEQAVALAFALERELFDRGRIAVVLEGASSADVHAASVCARGGLLALVPVPLAPGAAAEGGPLLSARVGDTTVRGRDPAALAQAVLDGAR